MHEAILEWSSARHYELIPLAWGAIALLLWPFRSRLRGRDVYPLLLALTWTPLLTTLLIWPDAVWPTYGSDFLRRMSDIGVQYSPVPPLEVGFRNLAFHPSYIASGALGAYATACIFSSRIRLSRLWGYALAIAFLVLDHALSVTDFLS